MCQPLNPATARESPCAGPHPSRLYLSGLSDQSGLLRNSWPWIATCSWDLTAWSGPWGISYAINITPDENTGIGIWTEDIFVKAMRTGKHFGTSRPILPPMPWETISNYSDEDLKAIFAYLRSIPAVKNRVPEPVIAPPPSGPAGKP